MLPYVDLPNMLFGSFQHCSTRGVDQARYPAALERLRKYTGREPGYEPITKLAQDRSTERFGETRPDRSVDGRSRAEAGELSQRYLQGIRDLFAKSGLKG